MALKHVAQKMNCENFETKVLQQQILPQSFLEVDTLHVLRAFCHIHVRSGVPQSVRGKT